MGSTESDKQFIQLGMGSAVDTNNCCRCCLIVGNSVGYKSLLKKRNLCYYTACTRISITPEDQLPKFVCKDCLRKLSDFYKFQQTCKSSYDILKNSIKIDHTKNMPIKDEEDFTCYDNHSETSKNSIKGNQSSNGEWESDDNKAISTVNLSKNRHVKQKFIKSNSDKTSKKYSTRIKTCPICNAKIKTNSLKRHMEIHNLEKPLHHCKICNKGFKSIIHFERHNKSNFIVCQICGKSIFNKTYEIHIKRHNKQKDYACETCGQKFYQRSLLKDHQLDRHMGRKYTCDYCKKQFVTKFAIRTHIYRHSETPRFKCDMCEKAYRSHWILTLHKRTHTGVLPYKCNTCQRSFSNLSKMKRHKISHTEERSYVCEYCNYAYKYKSSYRRHIERCKKKKER